MRKLTLAAILAASLGTFANANANSITTITATGATSVYDPSHIFGPQIPGSEFFSLSFSFDSTADSLGIYPGGTYGEGASPVVFNYTLGSYSGSATITDAFHYRNLQNGASTGIGNNSDGFTAGFYGTLPTGQGIYLDVHMHSDQPNFVGASGDLDMARSFDYFFPDAFGGLSARSFPGLDFEWAGTVFTLSTQTDEVVVNADVPEPSSWAMLPLGLAVLTLTRRSSIRKSRSQCFS